MKEKSLQLILASQSPRRKELLGWLGRSVIIKPSQMKEEISKFKDPVQIAEDLAFQKGVEILNSFSSQQLSATPVIVAADTIVVLDGKVLGKPNGPDEAKKTLEFLSGREHLVITGVYLGTVEHQRIFSCQTKVTFSKISADFLNDYVATTEPFDKAGSYGIQGMANAFIEKIEGSYSNVVGFPLVEFQKNLEALLETIAGHPVGNWREFFV